MLHFVVFSHTSALGDSVKQRRTLSSLEMLCVGQLLCCDAPFHRARGFHHLAVDRRAGIGLVDSSLRNSKARNLVGEERDLVPPLEAIRGTGNSPDAQFQIPTYA